MKSKWSYSPETPNLGQNRRFFVPCDFENWQMSLKNNSAHLLCYFKLSASFHSHLWIQNGVTVRRRLIWVKLSWRVFVPGDLEIWRMTLKNSRAHLLYHISNFVHHFIAICEFKKELQSGNAKFIIRSKSATLCPVWPWNLAGDLEKQ